jgi:hypothetical protein
MSFSIFWHTHTHTHTDTHFRWSQCLMSQRMNVCMYAYMQEQKPVMHIWHTYTDPSAFIVWNVLSMCLSMYSCVLYACIYAYKNKSMWGTCVASQKILFFMSKIFMSKIRHEQDSPKMHGHALYMCLCKYSIKNTFGAGLTWFEQDSPKIHGHAL